MAEKERRSVFDFEAARPANPASISRATIHTVLCVEAATQRPPKGRPQPYPLVCFCYIFSQGINVGCRQWVFTICVFRVFGVVLRMRGHRDKAGGATGRLRNVYAARK